MPELPEVETIARTLAPQVEGRRIVACELLNPSTFEGTIPLGKVVGGVIGRPGRRGKLLLLPLAFGSDPLPPVDEACPSGSLARCLACGDERITGLGFHLKMTGRLFVYPAGTPPEKHTRLLFDLDDGSRLFFDDTRKFGYVRVLSPSSVSCWPFWNSLGPEPLEMDADAFAACFAGRRGKIKLMINGPRAESSSGTPLLISPCWRGAGIFTRTKACSARASGPTRSSCPPTA